MSEKTIYTCDRCGKESNSRIGWVCVDVSVNTYNIYSKRANSVPTRFYTIDLCKDCTPQLGVETHLRDATKVANDEAKIIADFIKRYKK